MMISFFKVIGAIIYYIFKFTLGLIFELLTAPDSSQKSGHSDGVAGQYVGGKHLSKQEAELISSRGEDYWQNY